MSPHICTARTLHVQWCLLGRVLLGYFYPALASAKAAVQQDPEAFTQWMTYWCVHRLFHLCASRPDRSLFESRSRCFIFLESFSPWVCDSSLAAV